MCEFSVGNVQEVAACWTKMPSILSLSGRPSMMNPGKSFGLYRAQGKNQRLPRNCGIICGKSMHNTRIDRTSKAKKYGKRPYIPRKKHSKVPKGPFVFTRGFLDMCSESRDTTVATTIEELPLDSCSDIDYEGCLKNEVTLTINASKFSRDYYVKGKVVTNVKLVCKHCDARFFHPFKGKFEVWTNSRIHDWEECMDENEVPFSHRTNYLDMTEVVADCIEFECPSMCICGTPSCIEGMEVGPDGSPSRVIQEGGESRPLLQDCAVLIDLKTRFEAANRDGACNTSE